MNFSSDSGEVRKAITKKKTDKQNKKTQNTILEWKFHSVLEICSEFLLELL